MEKTLINKETTKRVIVSVGASLAFEGLEPSREAMHYGRAYLENTMSSAEARAKIKAMHACSFGR